MNRTDLFANIYGHMSGTRVMMIGNGVNLMST